MNVLVFFVSKSSRLDDFSTIIYPCNRSILTEYKTIFVYLNQFSIFFGRDLSLTTSFQIIDNKVIIYFERYKRLACKNLFDRLLVRQKAIKIYPFFLWQIVKLQYCNRDIIHFARLIYAVNSNLREFNLNTCNTHSFKFLCRTIGLF